MNVSLKNAYIIKSSSDTRKENDYYPTPPVATIALSRVINLPQKIWEPAAGKGWISNQLISLGHEVKSSDLHPYPNSLVEIDTPKDYLEEKVPLGFDCIVTNPPYGKGLADRFASKAIGEVSLTCMFLRLTFMEGIKRYQKVFSENPPDVYVFSRRINCDEDLFSIPKKQIGGMVAYAWFVWDRREKKKNIGSVRWIDPINIIEEMESKGSYIL